MKLEEKHKSNGDFPKTFNTVNLDRSLKSWGQCPDESIRWKF